MDCGAVPVQKPVLGLQSGTWLLLVKATLKVPPPDFLVPDHASRIRDVILVRRIFSSGNPRGSGICYGEGMERGRSVYEQPGTKVDGILSRQGGFPSK